jgi:glycosyltransferase involved in cell wall biosynthesis
MKTYDILHLTTFLQGGAGRAITDLACAQRERGHRVQVVTTRTDQGAFCNYPEYLRRLESSGVGLHLCDSLFTRDERLHAPVLDLLRQTFDPNAIDIVHAHAAVPASIGRQFVSAARRRVPVIQTQHGWGINKTSEQAAYDVDVLKHVDRIITTSRATAQLVGDYGAPRSLITIVPVGLPPEDEGGPPPEAAPVEALRAQGKRIVGCIGSVTPNKNQPLLLQALDVLEDASIAAVFVGEGSEDLHEEVERMQLENTVLTFGHQPAASRWLPLFDLLIVPSRTEGQGLVVLEGFRARVLVVGSHIPALTELIDNGRNGFIFNPVSAEALAKSIRRALALPERVRDEMLTAARGGFDRDFTIDRMIARHEEVYQEVIAFAAMAMR